MRVMASCKTPMDVWCLQSAHTSACMYYLFLFAEFDFDSDSAHRVTLIVNKDGRYEFILPAEFLDSMFTLTVIITATHL